MFKLKIISLAFFLSAICFHVANSQTVTLNNVSSKGFDGVKSIPGKIYYTFYFGEKSETKGMGNFILELYDMDLKKINTATIELSKNSKLAGSCFSGQYFLFVFTDMNDKKLTMVTLDETGKVIQKKEQDDVKRALLSPDNYANLLAADNDEFIVIRPLKEKKLGYAIERMDKDLNTKWSNEFAPEKGEYDALTSKFSNGKIFVLRHNKLSAMGNGFENTVFCYDGATGTEVYNYKIYDGEVSGFPSVIDVDDQGNLFTGGMYFKGTKFDETNSDGLFFLSLDAKGNKVAYSATPWKTVADKIKGDNTSALFGGKTKVLVENIIPKKDGSYTIIAETFRKSNNSAMTGGSMGMLGLASKSPTTSEPHESQIGFTIMDFVLFNFDKSGALADITKINKPDKGIIITGKATEYNGLKLALFMNKSKMFCYRYILEYNDKQYIV